MATKETTLTPLTNEHVMHWKSWYPVLHWSTGLPPAWWSRMHSKSHDELWIRSQKLKIRLIKRKYKALMNSLFCADQFDTFYNSIFSMPVQPQRWPTATELQWNFSLRDLVKIYSIISLLIRDPSRSSCDAVRCPPRKDHNGAVMMPIQSTAGTTTSTEASRS